MPPFAFGSAVKGTGESITKLQMDLNGKTHADQVESITVRVGERW